MATEQYRDIGGLLPGHGKLVHDLELHVLGHALLPQAGSVDPRGLALQNLHGVIAHDLAIQVGQHPGMLGVLQDGIDALHPVAGVLGVVIGDQRFEHLAPMQRAGQDLATAGLLVTELASGLLHPQFQLRLVGVQPHGSSGIRASDPALTNRQPRLTIQGAGVHQTPCLIAVTAWWRCGTPGARFTRG